MTPEGFEPIIAAVRQIKQERVDAAEDLSCGGDAEMPTTVDFWRRGRSVARTVLPPDRNLMLQAVWIGVPGYAADELYLIFETYGSERFDATMGRRPDPGELQALFQAGRTDLVSEQLVIQRGRRGHDDVDFVALPYDLDRPTGRLTWRDPQHSGQVGGLVAVTVLRAFQEQTLNEKVRAAGIVAPEDLPPEVVEFHQDMAATKVLALAGFPIAMPHDEDWQTEIFERSMDEGSLAWGEVGDETLHEPEPGKVTVLDLIGHDLRKKLERERGMLWAQDEAERTQNRAERRRADAARKKQG